MDEQPHSVIHFGDSRDHWWHADFIALMAQRLDVGRFRRVLDAGCGFGHWARVWLRHFGPGTELVGLDPERVSLGEAERRNAAFIATHGLDVRHRYVEAKVESLPFEDGAFDLVTLQTVLIHVADVEPAMRELYRVLAPGGVMLVAEPNNLAGETALFVDRPGVEESVVLQLFELELRIQRGKYKLGEGDNSAGEYLPRYFAQHPFTRVDGWLCDKTYGLRPPYDTPQAKAEIAEFRDFLAKGWHNRQPEVARRYYLAGGGTEAAFEVAWAAALAHDRWRVEAIDAGTYASGGGSVFHLYAAHKPAGG